MTLCTDCNKLEVFEVLAISESGMITNFILESSVGIIMILSDYFPFCEPLSEPMC